MLMMMAMTMVRSHFGSSHFGLVGYGPGLLLAFPLAMEGGLPAVVAAAARGAAEGGASRQAVAAAVAAAVRSWPQQGVCSGGSLAMRLEEVLGAAAAAVGRPVKSTGALQALLKGPEAADCRQRLARLNRARNVEAHPDVGLSSLVLHLLAGRPGVGGDGDAAAGCCPEVLGGGSGDADGSVERSLGCELGVSVDKPMLADERSVVVAGASGGTEVVVFGRMDGPECDGEDSGTDPSEQENLSEYEFRFFPASVVGASSVPLVPLASGPAETTVDQQVSTEMYLAALGPVERADSEEGKLDGIMAIAGEATVDMVLDLKDHEHGGFKERAFEWMRYFTFLGMPVDIIEGQLMQAAETIADPEDYSRFLAFCGRGGPS